MKKQNGFSQIFVMVVMLVLAIALPVTANLVKKVQDNRSSAATPSVSCSQAKRGITSCGTGADINKVYICSPIGTQTNYQWHIEKTCGQTEVCSSGKCVDKNSNSSDTGTKASLPSCSSAGGACVDSYTGMSSGITCSGSTGGTNGGTTNTGLSCGSGQVCCVPKTSTSGGFTGGTTTKTGDQACKDAGGACQTTTTGTLPAAGSTCTLNGISGTFKANLCTGDYNSVYRCCIPGSVPAVPAAPSTPDCSDQGTHCWGEAYKTGCTGTKLATDNNCASKATVCAGTYYGTYNGCGDSRGCLGTKVCTTPTPAPTACTPNCACAASTLVGQTCSNGCSGTCAGIKAAPVNGELGPANGTIVTTKPTSAGACSKGTVTWTDSIATDGKYNWTCAGINGGTSINGSASKADCTIGIQKCTTSNKYFTCKDGLWANSTTTTTCATGKVCTSGEIGTAVCKDPEYVAPKLSMMFAVHGLKANPDCFGNLNFKVSISKDGSNLSYIGDAVATVVPDKFSVKTEDQVLKISNFALPQTFALTDKIKIGISSDRKTLTTIYGKDSQNSGYPALDASNITVSSLDGKVLSFYEFPMLNGDIGSAEKIGVKDNIVNSTDWVYMKSQWNNRCEAGKNIESDLNGDCIVNSADFQILKNAMENQYSQKTF